MFQGNKKEFKYCAVLSEKDKKCWKKKKNQDHFK